ncbi:hypothetical protein L1987_66423 [Smallanthus sonchifolius]|uniref:Uncharacterized protein n=1 Tax=Smallanthus sonchifolius TaxID=185202 RepID=A0ACB9BXC2_9ASTR|nr:hypothetical protein L1987_66423 [Smallanthus sonchifolius]
MVANVSSTAITPNPKVSSRGPSPAKAKRAPLVPSEADNNAPLPRRPKSRDVSSRYLSSTASIATTMTSTSSSGSFSSTTTTSSSNSMCTPRRRFPSPLVSSTNLMTPASTVNIKRAQSTERRRPGTPRIGEMSATAKMLTTMPARNLSVSFQGPSFALPVSKVSKPLPTASNNGSRPCTPERRSVTPVTKPGFPNSIDQKRWPGRSRQGSFLTRSVDFTNENMKLSGSGTATAVRALQKSMIGETELKANKPEIPEINKSIDKLFDNNDNSDRALSDAESVSSGSTLGNVRRATPRAIVVPARYRQETVNRLRRVQPEPVSPPLSRNSKLLSGNRHLKDVPALSPRGSSPSPVRGAVRPATPVRGAVRPATPVRGAVRPATPVRGAVRPASPVRGAVRPASPCKSVLSSPSRSMSSPTRARSAIGSNSNLGSTHSILSFAAETRRRKVGDNAIIDAHVLRMLHNKYLQWRFANARADAAMLVQRATAQKSLYNSWVTTSKMRQSVISKQKEIQQLKQNLKLYTVLKNQTRYLKIWDQVERDHVVSLSGTIVSLESSTLRVPLVDGAKVDVQSLKNAIRSADDVMQAMASLIRSLVTKVEHVNTLASELASTTTNERSTIDQCKDLLSILTRMEVQDCSLRTHILQLQHPPPTTITEL